MSTDLSDHAMAAGINSQAARVDTGLPWLGGVPAHWSARPLRFDLRAIEQGWSPQCDNSTAEIHEWGVLKVGCVNGTEFDESQHKRLPDDLEPRPVYEIKPGDILMSRANTTELLGGAVLVRAVRPRLMLCDKLYRMRVAASAMDPEFLVYAFGSHASRYQFERDATGASASMKNIGQDTIKALVLPRPPVAEQRAIAAFLDCETARIDALIEKKRRQIELLHEKRAALISHAVTKGLDPTAPVKDSGIDWLGLIPAHWQIIRIGLLCSVGNGSTPSRDNPEYWSDGAYPWLTSAKINEEVIEAADEAVSEIAFRECHLPWIRPESVLLAITGEGQTRGRAALLRCASTISQHLAYISARSARLRASFLWRALQSQYEWLRMESSGTGSTRAALTCEFIRTIKIPVPPADEQEAVTAFIEREVHKLDLLVTKISVSMDRLHEYRTALISAAVTGKIDVWANVTAVEGAPA